LLIINNKSIPITSNITLTSITEEAYALLVGAVAQQNNPILFVTNCDEEMLQLADHIAFFAPHLRIFPIPAWDSLPYDRVSPSVDLATKRMEMLCRIANLPKGAPPYIVITPVASLLQRIPPRALLRQLSLQINKGENLDRDNFIAILVSYGFLRSATVGAIGEFAVRGSIIDLAIANEPSGVRLDFVGNALESIREFDLDSQITGSFIDAVTIYPASEIILNPETIKLFRSQMLQQFGAKVAADPLYESVSSGRRYVGLEHWLPLFYPYLSSIFDYLPSLQVIYDSKIETTMKSQLDLIAEYFENRRISTKSTVQTSVYNPIEPISMWLSLEELQQNLAQHALIKISKFKSDEKMVDLAFNKMIDFATQSS
jgi:transcription-repair coupling factor (superfamily II helicase)